MSAALQADLLGLALIGPGLPSWEAAQAVLAGQAPWVNAPTVVPAPQRLPAAERRRAGAAVKIALAVADAACADAGQAPGALATVFTSSSGDGANCHALCEALASADEMDRLVSPTRFTNSVHNAAAGYWHIAVAGRASSTSLCAHDESFGAGLVAALTQVHASRAPLLLVASDTPYPEPLNATRPLPDTLGVALVLAPSDPARAARARLAAQLLPLSGDSPSACADAGLEVLRRGLPSGRALPLLQALARGRESTVDLPLQAPLALRLALRFA